MTEKSHATKTLGLELTTTGLKAAEFSYKLRKPHLVHLFDLHFDINRRSINPLYLTDEERSFLDLSGTTLVVSAVDAGETLVRPLEIKLTKDKDIETVLTFQAEPLLPYPVENALLDTIKISQTSESTLLTLLAIKKDHLRRHLEPWTTLEIAPEVVTTVPHALAAFSHYVLSNTTNTFCVLHLGKEQTCCIVVDNGKLLASKTSPFNLQVLIQTYQKEHELDESDDDEAVEHTFAEIDWMNLANNPTSETLQMVKNFQADIGKVIFALMKQTKGMELPQILVTGEAAMYGSLESLLLEEFQDNLLTFDSPTDNTYSSLDLKRHAITVGEALTALPNAKNQVNFLQGEFTYPRPWKRLKQPLLLYLGLSSLLAVVFYFLGTTYISHQEQNLRQEYISLLTTMHKSYPDFEKEVAAMLPAGESSTQQGIPSLESLTQSDLNFRLSLLEKELQKVPDLYALTPNVPKVSDLLAWLAHHPQVVGSGNSAPLINIDGISYAMIKRPELTKKQEKYQVKVELDFSSANATAAREFHDALMAPNDFIDPKSDIKWTNNKGRYKASFMLKDRTIYP